MSNLNDFFKLNENEIRTELKKVALDFDLFNFEVGNGKSLFLDHFKKYEDQDSVTFYGGSFNPIHLGHLECIKLCPEKNIVMVLDRNPHKELRDVNYKNEIETILKRIAPLNISLYPGFWINEEKNPTSSWITKVNRKEVNLLMGDDSFINILSWKNPDLILNTIKKLYVVPRNHQFHQLGTVRDICKSMNSKLEIIFLSNHEYQAMSSTSIRNNSH